MKSLICPKCGDHLASITFEDVEVDRCPKCAGIWFDAQEVEQLKAIPGSETLDKGNPYLISPYDRTTAPCRCPRCQIEMRRILEMDRYSVWYEQCQKCHGTWLDAGEFKQVKYNFLGGFIQRVKQRLR